MYTNIFIGQMTKEKYFPHVYKSKIQFRTSRKHMTKANVNKDKRIHIPSRLIIYVSFIRTQ